MPGGRPRIYTDVIELEKECEAYFIDCHTITEITKTNSGEIKRQKILDQWIKNPTITGLALYLGFADKTTLYEYRDREEFSYPIKKSITMIEQFHEGRLTENSVAGTIFALKNMGWKDKTETDMNMSGEVSVKTITGMEVK